MFSVEARSLDESIRQLETSSNDFLKAFQNNDMTILRSASIQGMSSLRTIHTVLLNYRDETIKSGTPAPQFSSHSTGTLFEGITLNHQKGLARDIGATLNSLTSHRTPTLGELLNKIKHAIPSMSTFDVASGKHELILTGDKHGRPDYILKFGVLDFVNYVNNLVPEVDSFYK